MTTYATQADMEKRFGAQEIADLAYREEGDALAPALADATALIDGYLRGRYALPLSPVPALVTALACDLARFALYDAAPPEAVEVRAKQAHTRLREIAQGVVELDAARVAAGASGGGDVLWDAPGRVFDRDTLEGF